MSGYESTFRDFRYLLDVASKEHIQEVATSLGLTAHGQGLDTEFRDAQGQSITQVHAHELGQSDPQAQRLIYNLWMTYAH